jgi:hypothetical protein
MPKIDVEIAESLPEPLEGHTYTIGECELFTSQVRSYKGLRVDMTAEDGTKVVAALWTREIAGTKSKLGAFVAALGDDTDKWIGKKVKIVKWRSGDREIQVVP